MINIMVCHVQFKHLLFLIVIIIAVIGNGSLADIPGDQTVFVEVSQLHMGMPVHLRVYAPDEEAGRLACRAAFERIAELNQILSDYETDSELSGLVRQAGAGPVHVSDELFTVLAASKRLAQQTDGLIDPTAAPVIRLWRRARKGQRLPDPVAVHEALGRIGHEQLRLNAADQTAELLLPGMQLDLGAIAKGYVGDEALSVLRDFHLTRAMFEAGGDMVFGDPPPGETGWLVRPETPHLHDHTLANVAAATSGDTVQFVEIDGRRYGHIIDPRTGEPVTTQQVCLVVAPAGLMADPLATLGTLMPSREFQAFIAKNYPEAKAQVVTRPAEPHTYRSEQQP
jgi:FAD:protein FMN transferase